MPIQFAGKNAETRTMDRLINLAHSMNALLARLADRATIDDLTPCQFAAPVDNFSFLAGSEQEAFGYLCRRILSKGKESTQCL